MQPAAAAASALLFVLFHPNCKRVTIARDQGKQKDLAHFKQCLGDPLDPMKSKRHAQLCTEQDENNIALGRGQGIFPDTAKATDEKLAMIAELEAIVVRLKTATGSKASVATTPSPTAAGSVSMLEIMDEPGKKGAGRFEGSTSIECTRSLSDSTSRHPSPFPPVPPNTNFFNPPSLGHVPPACGNFAVCVFQKCRKLIYLSLTPSYPHFPLCSFQG